MNIQWPTVQSQEIPFKSLTKVSPDFELLTIDEKLFMILDEGCKHRPILKIILKMWIVCFN